MSLSLSLCVCIGRFHPELTPSKEDGEQVGYECAGVMSSIWGWSHSKLSPLHHYFEKANLNSITWAQNTLALQAHQFFWNHVTKAYDDVIIERSGWGSNIGPSVGKCRKAMSGEVRPPVYTWNGESKVVVSRT
jgi:hypothetical protein